LSLELDTSVNTSTLRSKGAWCFVEFSLIRVHGQDATRFLQAQTTNDVHLLNVGDSQDSCLIDRKSRPVGCYRLYRQPEDYAIICDTSVAKPILDHLEKFKFADKVDFEEAINVSFLTLQGQKSRSMINKTLDVVQKDQFEKDASQGTISGVPVQIFKYSLTGEEGFLLAVESDKRKIVEEKLAAEAVSHDLQTLMPPVLELARIEAGIPKLGQDFTDENLLAETTLDETAVSYNKGCFQGQEVLARIRGQGAPTRALVGLTIEPPPATPWKIDTPIELNGETIGWIKSNCYSKFLNKYIAMAMVKRDYRTPGKTRQVTINGVQANITVQLLPFYKADPPNEIARRVYEQALAIFAKEDESKATEDVQSINLLKEVVTLDPLFEDAYESLGVILNRNGKTDEAIEWMEYLAKLNPDSVMAHTNLSVFYVEKGWKEKAEDEKAISMSIRMRMAAEQFSKDKEADEQRKAKEKEALERMSMFQQVLEIDAEDQLANYGFGDCLVALSRFEEAVPHLQKAIQLKPSHSVAYVALGSAFEGLNQIEDAKSTYVAGIDAAAKRGDGEPLKKMQERLNALK